MSAGCIFCKIIAGELPSLKVYEDDNVLAFLDIRPVNPGHTLVVSKKHSTNIFDVPQEDWTAVAKTVRTLAAVIEKAVSADGININMNNREHAGQVVDHLHVHIIPRFKGDGFKLWHQTSYKEGEAVNVQERIKAQVS
ncbi:MAG: HIT family protein [Candidatus Kaiserbacteria bacterium]|nr:HIT family protein [Candidatus Kaiserbacteria bacterium]